MQEVIFSVKSGLQVGHKDWLEGAASGLKQKWDCSPVEDEFEGNVMDWLEDDEVMKQWEDVSKEEEKITVSKMEGKILQLKKRSQRRRTNKVKW